MWFILHNSVLHYAIFYIHELKLSSETYRVFHIVCAKL